MGRLSHHRGPLSLALLVVAFAVFLAACSAPQTTFEPRSDQADVIQTLYILIIVVSGAIGALVLGAMAYLLFRFRAKPGVPARQIHGNSALEVAWTLAPIAALVMVGVPTVFAIVGAAASPSEDALHITVTAHQWWWEVDYEGLGPDGGTLTTANEIHIPVGGEVAIRVESDDVIHSFWVPQLIGKVDAVPNHPNDLPVFTPNEVGVFYGQCAEFCGLAHALMRFRVIVDPLADFERWVDALQTPPAPPEQGTFLSSGQAIFVGSCSRCHTIFGTPAAGKVGPDLSLFGERLTMGAGIMDNTTENVEAWVADLRAIKPIPEGLLGGRADRETMPTFAGALSDDEIAAVAAYIKSLTID